MSANDAGIKVLKALGKHADLIMVAYDSNQNILLETSVTANAVDELLRLRIALRDDNIGDARLNSSIKLLLDQSLKTNRLRMLNADIATAVEGVLLLAEQYKQAKRGAFEHDRLQYLHALQDNVHELCDSLLEQTRGIWRQIDSNFNTVALLSGKIALNKSALSNVERTLKTLDLIDLSEMYQAGSSDRALRQLFHLHLPRTIELCRQDLGDAIHRLNKMLFKLNRLAARGRLVQQFRNHWDINRSFEPADYIAGSEVPTVFNLASAMPIGGFADIHNPSQELSFSEMLTGLRKERPALEQQSVTRISTDIADQAPLEIKLSKFKMAVRDVFFNCLKDNKPISGLESYQGAPEGIDVEIWLYALMAEYNAMDEDSRKYFSLEFEGEFDQTFSANFKAENIILCPN